MAASGGSDRSGAWLGTVNSSEAACARAAAAAASVAGHAQLPVA
jgi:hypothetical protein